MAQVIVCKEMAATDFRTTLGPRLFLAIRIPFGLLACFLLCTLFSKEARADTCSCTAPDNSCSASISCPAGCVAICGNDGNCSTQCAGIPPTPPRPKEGGRDKEGTSKEGTDGEGTDGEGTDGEGADGEGTGQRSDSSVSTASSNQVTACQDASSEAFDFTSLGELIETGSYSFVPGTGRRRAHRAVSSLAFLVVALGSAITIRKGSLRLMRRVSTNEPEARQRRPQFGRLLVVTVGTLGAIASILALMKGCGNEVKPLEPCNIEVVAYPGPTLLVLPDGQLFLTVNEVRRSNIAKLVDFTVGRSRRINEEFLEKRSGDVVRYDERFEVRVMDIGEGDGVRFYISCIAASIL